MKAIAKKLIPKELLEAHRLKRLHAKWDGDRHACNFCGSNLSAFEGRGVETPVIRELDIVPAGFRYVTCPICKSYDRDRLLWFYLERHGELGGRPIKVLHIAPEFTIEKKLSKLPGVEYISGDLDPALAMVRVDVTAMEFGDDSFDVVLCNHVLEHVLDVGQAMRELLRVTKPGGWAVLQVPIGRNLIETIEDTTVQSEEERLARFGQVDHFRVFAQQDYVSRLEREGWQVELVDMGLELGPEVVERYGLSKGEILYVCRKPGT